MRSTGPWILAVLVGTAGAALAQPRIYSCIDAQGRRLTADRPIPECLDREQLEYGSSGIVRGRLPPAMSPRERAAQEERKRHEEEESQRAAERRRQDLSLLQRFPDEASHERARTETLGRLDAALRASAQRTQSLAGERAALEAQLQAARDPAARAQTQNALDSNAAQTAAHARTQAAQADERARTAARLDEERQRLAPLWAPADRPARAASAASAAAPAAGRFRPPASAAAAR